MLDPAEMVQNCVNWCNNNATNDFACGFLLVSGSWRLCDGCFRSDFSNLCLGLTCIPPLPLFCFFTILCGGCEETGCDDCGGCDG